VITFLGLNICYWLPNKLQNVYKEISIITTFFACLLYLCRPLVSEKCSVKHCSVHSLVVFYICNIDYLIWICRLPPRIVSTSLCFTRIVLLVLFHRCFFKCAAIGFTWLTPINYIKSDLIYDYQYYVNHNNVTTILENKMSHILSLLHIRCHSPSIQYSDPCNLVSHP
jgi:hypothetical protein